MVPAGAGGGLDSAQVAAVLTPLFTAMKQPPPLAEVYALVADTWAASAAPPLAVPATACRVLSLLAAEERGCVRTVALMAALTQGRNFLLRGVPRDVEKAREDALGEEHESDFFLLMRAWSYADQAGYSVEACRRLGIHAQGARAVGPLFEQFLEIARKEGLDVGEARGDDVAVLPADGRHLVFPDIDTAEGFYVKGAKFTVRELLDDEELATRFAGGAMVISRLCPVDYHRFHFPVAGTPRESRLVQGWLYSVSPIALRRRIRYLVENKREVTVVEGSPCGPVAMIEVGATNVGSIRQSFVPGRAVAKGEEKGLFAFGGSCVITLFPRGSIRFDDDLVAQSREQRETYARMGERLGVLAARSS